MGDKPKRKCKICGEAFTPQVWNSKYCSDPCRGEAERQRKRVGGFAVPHEDSPLDIKVFSEVELLEELSRRGLFVEVMDRQTDRKVKIKTKRFHGDYIKMGVISCTHFGSKYQQFTHLKTFYRLLAERGIDTCIHCGDAVEGTGDQYRGQRYEMFIHGYRELRNYFIENYPCEEGITTYIIDGSHDYSHIKKMGANILEDAAKERDDITYLGSFAARVEIGDQPIKYNIMHGAGGVPYARSYRLQKVIEGFSSENKPHVLLYGHLHVSDYLPQYRNVEGFIVPCFQAQTPYLKAKGLQPVLAGLILEIMPDDRGVATSRVEFIHFHIPKERDY